MSGKTSNRHQAECPGSRDEEKRLLLGEIALLTDQQDALKSEIASRKERLLLMMAEDGDRAFEAEGVATAMFKRRRSFKIKDAARLAKMFKPSILAENVKVTAAFYDAAAREGYRIDEAVTMGEDESLTVSRPRSKEAKAIREGIIAESKKKAAEAVAAYREKIRQF